MVQTNPWEGLKSLLLCFANYAIQGTGVTTPYVYYNRPLYIHTHIWVLSRGFEFISFPLDFDDGASMIMIHNIEIHYIT